MAIRSEEDETELRQRRMLGYGLACDRMDPALDVGRDLRFIPGPNGRQLALVAGMASLAQDLEIALTTRLGDDVFNTSFGFDGLNALAEETVPVLVRERVRIAIVKMLSREPRIARIVDVKLEDGRLEQPRGGSRELEVRVVFETVAGTQASATLGKVISRG
jgi:phage baseplate assembly protein W